MFYRLQIVMWYRPRAEYGKARATQPNVRFVPAHRPRVPLLLFSPAFSFDILAISIQSRCQIIAYHATEPLRVSKLLISTCNSLLLIRALRQYFPARILHLHHHCSPWIAGLLVYLSRMLSLLAPALLRSYSTSKIGCSRTRETAGQKSQPCNSQQCSKRLWDIAIRLRIS